MSALGDGRTSCPSQGSSRLFHGITFWFSRQVPSRSSFQKRIREHGGALTEDEAQADMKIHDHARKAPPPDTYSYSFIEASIQQGMLANKEDHRAGTGKGTARKPGGIAQPVKGSRVPFTKDEDCLLWDYVTSHLNSGGKDGGNVIYESFEQMHPRHTSQSWRDRWRKHLSGRPRPLPCVPSQDSVRVESTQVEPARTNTTANRPSITRSPHLPPQPIPEEGDELFDAEAHLLNNVSATDEIKLFRQAGHIQNMEYKKQDQGWEAFASEEDNKHYLANEWKLIWEKKVGPVFMDQVALATYTDSPDTKSEPSELRRSEVMQSPNERAKANSSKRLTSGRTNVSISQSSESQTTSQEVTMRSGLDKKRRRDDVGSEAGLLSSPEGGNHDNKSRHESPLFVEDDTLSFRDGNVSPSLTEPTASHKRQRVDKDILPSSQVENIVGRRSRDAEPQAARTSNQAELPRKGISEQPQSILSPEPETAPQSSDSSTTTPGNTAREHILSSMPTRVAEPFASSQFSTTIPGNTAPSGGLLSVLGEETSDEADELREAGSVAAFKEACLRLGYSTEEIEYALTSTSELLEYAQEALTKVRETGFLPKDLKGVWSDADDADLLSRDAERRRKVESKHSAALRDVRLEYLDRLHNPSSQGTSSD